LSFIELSGNKALLELSNETAHTVYLFYEPARGRSDLAELYRYRLRCETYRKEMDSDDYVSHILPDLTPLENESKIRFLVESIPRDATKCHVSVIYFDDQQVVKILNERPLDVNASEQKAIDEGKKSVHIDFDINTAE